MVVFFFYSMGFITLLHNCTTIFESNLSLFDYCFLIGEWIAYIRHVDVHKIEGCFWMFFGMERKTYVDVMTSDTVHEELMNFLR